MYHRFGDSDDLGCLGMTSFDRQMRVLRDNFSVISLQDLVNEMKNGRNVPPNAVVITIDDAYRDCYQYAFPILRKYRIPATVYVTTDFVDAKIWMWPDLIEYILGHTSSSDYTLEVQHNPRRFSLTSLVQRQAAWSDIADYCLQLSEVEKNQLIAQLAVDLKVSIPTIPLEGYQAMSWEQLREFKDHSIDVGGHTRTHPRLTAIPYTNLVNEIEGCKSRIEDMIDGQVESFAYPHGTTSDYNNQVKTVVKAAGYTNAVVAYFDRQNVDLFELRRYGVGQDTLEFSKIVFGTRFLRTKAAQ